MKIYIHIYMDTYIYYTYIYHDSGRVHGGNDPYEISSRTLFVQLSCSAEPLIIGLFCGI